MKKVLKIIALLIISASSSFALFAGGDGTSDTPYEISNLAQLDSVRHYLDKDFILVNDLDFNGSVYDSARSTYNHGWVPIGYSPNGGYSGTFDGNGKTIANLYIDRSSSTNVGLFGYLAGAKVNSVKLVNVDVEGEKTTGALAGLSVSTIVSKCFSSGNVKSGSSAGGLVAHMSSAIVSESYSTCDVSSGNGSGGLVGVVFNNSTILNSFAKGTIFGSSSSHGGLVGESTKSTIQNSVFYGDVEGSGTTVGGLIGLATTTTVTNSFYNSGTAGQTDTGKGEPLTTQELKDLPLSVAWDFRTVWAVTSTLNSGMPMLIAHYEYETGIGTKESPYEIKDIIGLNAIRNNLSAHYKLTNDITFAGTILDSSHSVNNFNKTGWSPIGEELNPFIGSLDGAGNSISGLYINSSSANFIGLFGVTGENGEIANLHLKKCRVTGAGSVGSIVGKAQKLVITNCSFDGYIKGGAYYIGGLVGQFSFGEMKYCHSSGYVEGKVDVGNLVGRNYQGIIENSYATGDVSSNSHEAGGLVGSNYSASTIKNCYATGNVTATQSIGVGGLVGVNVSSTVTNSYYNSETSGQIDTAKGDARTTAELQQFSTFKTWDFDTIWTMSSVDETGYPILSADFLYENGKGTETDPYQVKTVSDLHMVKRDLSAHYILMNDIDFDNSPFDSLHSDNNKGWYPIGYEHYRFKGTFNGNGFSIRNLYINRSIINIGLFGSVEGAKIEKLAIENCNINGFFYVGALVGLATSSIIENCFSTGVVRGSNDIGGLIGISASSTTTNCYSICDIVTLDRSGGIIAYANITYDPYRLEPLSIINNCYYNSETSNQTDTLKGEGKTTDELKKEITFEGWDFDSTWIIGENITYPKFKNVAPVITSISDMSVNEDDTLTTTLQDIVYTNGDGDSLVVITRISIVGMERKPYSMKGNQIVTNENYNGITSQYVGLTDGIDTTDFKKVVITVNAVNDAPVITSIKDATIPADSFHVVLLENIEATDAEGDDLTVILKTDDVNCIITNTTATPKIGYTGIVELKVAVTDGVDTSSYISMNLTVDAPTNTRDMKPFIEDGYSLVIAPTPTKDIGKLILKSEETGKIEFTIFNKNEKVIAKLSTNIESNRDNELKWSVIEKLPKGIYFVEMRVNGSKKAMVRLIKIN